MKHTLYAFAGCALIALGLAACGGDDDPTNTPVPSASIGASIAATTSPATAAPSGSNVDVDICSLLTSDEISSTISATVGDGQPSQTLPNYQCEWDSADGQSAVGIALYNTGDLAAAEAQFNSLASVSTPVNGLGDKAQWAAFQGTGTLQVIKGTELFAIQLLAPNSDSDLQSLSRTLADKAVARMPLIQVP